MIISGECLSIRRRRGTEDPGAAGNSGCRAIRIAARVVFTGRATRRRTSGPLLIVEKARVEVVDLGPVPVCLQVGNNTCDPLRDEDDHFAVARVTPAVDEMTVARRVTLVNSPEAGHGQRQFAFRVWAPPSRHRAVSFSSSSTCPGEATRCTDA